MKKSNVSEMRRLSLLLIVFTLLFSNIHLTSVSAFEEQDKSDAEIIEEIIEDGNLSLEEENDPVFETSVNEIYEDVFSDEIVLEPVVEEVYSEEEVISIVKSQAYHETYESAAEYLAKEMSLLHSQIKMVVLGESDKGVVEIAKLILQKARTDFYEPYGLGHARKYSYGGSAYPL